jgi:hypothetical protein
MSFTHDVEDPGENDEIEDQEDSEDEDGDDGPKGRSDVEHKFQQRIVDRTVQ